MKKKPLILIVNDDGILSPGLRFLVKISKKIGRVFLIAPDKEQSGKSHAITVDNKITINKIKKTNSYAEYSCSGTPVDCVKLATNKLLIEKPSLCISGINHGANYSISTLYSATVHAAIEGAIEGIPAISISHVNYSNKVNFSSFEMFLTTLIQKVLKNGLLKGTTLNINIPDIHYNKVKGIKICRQGKGNWIEKVISKSKKENEYSITGFFKSFENKTDTDIWAIENGFISIVPISIDMTDYNYINRIKDWEHEF